jgi:hypothetical protein
VRPALIAAVVVVALGIPGTVAFERVQRTRGPTFTVSGRKRWLLVTYLTAFTTAVIVMLALAIFDAVT